MNKRWWFNITVIMAIGAAIALTSFYVGRGTAPVESSLQRLDQCILMRYKIYPAEEMHTEVELIYNGEDGTTVFSKRDGDLYWTDDPIEALLEVGATYRIKMLYDRIYMQCDPDEHYPIRSIQGIVIEIEKIADPPGKSLSG